MARSSSYKYDPSTGQWKKSTTTKKSTSQPVKPPKKGDKKNNKKSAKKSTTTKTSTNTKKGSSNLTSSNPSKNTSSGKTEKKYNTIELNTLTGTLNYIATNKTIKLCAGDTITLKGIGKYLSGNYYVQEVTRSISSNGYSHSATLLKTDMGNKLKMSTSTNKKTEKTKTKKVTSSSKSTNKPQRTYTVKKGDCLWKIAKKFYGNGALYTKIYDANSKQIAKPNLIYVGQKLVIP